jgi:hypothetical protein
MVALAEVEASSLVVRADTSWIGFLFHSQPANWFHWSAQVDAASPLCFASLPASICPIQAIF